MCSAHFGSTYTKVGTIQRRLAWPLHKDDMKIHEAFHIFRSERDTCSLMFITALFIIARTWKQPRCPSAGKWIRNLWYKYTMEYYSAIKKNTFESVLMRWIKLEPIIQSEVSQKDKTPIQYTNAYIWNLERL